MSVGEKVIRPPMEEVARGKVFRPSKKLRNKNWFMATFGAVALWLLIIGLMWLIVELIQPGLFIAWWDDVSLWYWVISAFWYIPYVVLYPIYLRAFEYSVLAKSGETMPEIYVKKGLINITRKHVPFRTITNIASRAGPFDRLFGIGSIEIETAGFSGQPMSGPEEKLEGLTFYEELRDFILVELRKFKDPYVTGTEVSQREEAPVALASPDNIEDEILLVLREIRDLLKRERE